MILNPRINAVGPERSGRVGGLPVGRWIVKPATVLNAAVVRAPVTGDPGPANPATQPAKPAIPVSTPASSPTVAREAVIGVVAVGVLVWWVFFRG